MKHSQTQPSKRTVESGFGNRSITGSDIDNHSVDNPCMARRSTASSRIAMRCSFDSPNVGPSSTQSAPKPSHRSEYVDRKRKRSLNEQGSVLPLLPVLIVVCFLLGTLSVSTASTFLAKRELYNAAAAAANDAVSGINDEKYFAESIYELRLADMQILATQSVAARVGDTIRLRPEDIKITEEAGGVRVTIEADFSPVFRGFLPGGLKKTRIKATALAVAREIP
jgi:hypothetical protein